MSVLAAIVIGLIALLHIGFLVLDMFPWDKPVGLKAFGQTLKKARAANQGLYNGFLAAGQLWGLSLGAAGKHIQVFFLLCVLVAGLYGAATARCKILYIQALPAAGWHQRTAVGQPTARRGYHNLQTATAASSRMAVPPLRPSP